MHVSERVVNDAKHSAIDGKAFRLLRDVLTV